MLVSKLIKLDKILKANQNKKSRFDLQFITNYFNFEKIDISQVKKFYRNELKLNESREFYIKNRIRNLEGELKEIKNEKEYLNTWMKTIGF